MGTFRTIFLYLFSLVLIATAIGLYKAWRNLDDKGQATVLFEKMMPNLVEKVDPFGDPDFTKPRGGNIPAIVAAFRADEAAEAQARLTGKPRNAPQVRAIPTPAPDNRLITEWGTGRKLVALTYDDGPNAAFSPRLIGLLREKNAKATFFVLGQQVARGEEIMRAAVAEGHEYGGHSWSHKQLSTLKGKALNDEIMKGQDEIERVTGKRPRLLRPPYGAQNQTVRDFAQANDIYLINWSIDTNDWRTNTKVDAIIKEAVDKAYDGCIILMHDRLERTIQATGPIIDALHAKGYKFVTVSELLGFNDNDTTPTETEVTAETDTETTGATAPNTNIDADTEPLMDDTPPPFLPETTAAINTTVQPTSTPAPTPTPSPMLPAPVLPNVAPAQQPTDAQFDTAVPDLPDDVITQPAPTRY